MSPRNTFTQTNLSQSGASIRIEQLVRAIARTDKPAFDITHTRSGDQRIRETRLSRHFQSIQQLLDVFDDRYCYAYSEDLQAFKEACQDIGLERSPVGLTCLNDSGTRYLSSHETMNLLVDRIRQLICSKKYRRKAGDRRYEAKQKQATITKYVNWVLNRYSRTVVVRVDFHYRAAARGRLRVEHVFEDLDQLIEARERHPVFRDATGYVCSVEQGEDKGFHIHAAFFFNGAEVRCDCNKARQIGELWVEQVTRGAGYFFSCNDEKDSYGDELGIGTVKRADDSVRSKVIKAMHYLAKDGQHLRFKPAGARAFRMGQV
ncbi:inovirus-type Gp2 protein [Pseudomonas sp. LPB0260]|uniref:YagK/YfjJ domain-containing protein n=1 Tax=Pseudomonas sp. LPB0260 TaxID=2614442 RepID=UPI0015C21296|nr:inovirus-type Gp2 protein [Pseudomonas sp. LPB0260]QLC72375.1 inovirus-type Gp2 protein [Pseudomonas sp. LPB0260]QLC75151.1 inovirus-type Gp2 protein [Pseudomonas sp. LPB0260]